MVDNWIQGNLIFPRKNIKFSGSRLFRSRFWSTTRKLSGNWSIVSRAGQVSLPSTHAAPVVQPSHLAAGLSARADLQASRTFERGADDQVSGYQRVGPSLGDRAVPSIVCAQNVPPEAEPVTCSGENDYSLGMTHQEITRQRFGIKRPHSSIFERHFFFLPFHSS